MVIGIIAAIAVVLSVVLRFFQNNAREIFFRV